MELRVLLCVGESPLARGARGKRVLLCVTEGEAKVPDQESGVKRIRAEERAKAKEIQDK
jgi:hypothetical protein